MSELLTSCSIGTKVKKLQSEGEITSEGMHDSSPFFGQIGPIYLFSDAISIEQVQGIYSLGPSYMYSFLDNEAALVHDNPLPSGFLDAKDGLSSKIVFGLNAQVIPFSLVICATHLFFFLFYLFIFILMFFIYLNILYDLEFCIFSRLVVVGNCLMSHLSWICN